MFPLQIYLVALEDKSKISHPCKGLGKNNEPMDTQSIFSLSPWCLYTLSCLLALQKNEVISFQEKKKKEMYLENNILSKVSSYQKYKYHAFFIICRFI